MINIIGWLGTIALLLSYALLSTHTIPAGMMYYSINLFGAIAVALISYKQKAWQSMFINTVFGMLSMIGLVKLVWV